MDQASQARRATLCDIDFASNSTALCAKTWSTSPAALIYDLQTTPWQGKYNEFEAQICANGKSAVKQAAGQLAVFKYSTNGSDTSATYAPSALLYDHLSRWLGVRVMVPETVVQSFPIDWYHERVVSKGLELTSKHRSQKMVHAAWILVDDVLTDPAAHPLAAEMLIDNDSRLWGVNARFTGRRYGPEVNGTRASGWGKGQNRDFQQTAPFRALRSELPIDAAAKAAIEDTREDPAMSEALAAGTDPLQVQWWAAEILEIVLLDYLLGQQDRIGNIDYQWRWLWIDSGELQSEPYSKKSSPPAPDAKRMRISWLNDNDAGVRSSYTNYAKLTGMLENLRHFDAALFSRLGELAADFRDQGPVYQAIESNYYLTSREFERIAKRVAEAYREVAQACKAGLLTFDLDRIDILAGTSAAVKADCE